MTVLDRAAKVGWQSAIVRVWRAFAKELADIVCIERSGGLVAPQMHALASVTLLSSPTVVRLESRRSLVAEAGSILFVPSLELHSIRAQGSTSLATQTLLVGPRQPEGISENQRHVLVKDAELGARLAIAFADLTRHLRSVDCIPALRSALSSVAAHGTPLVLARSRYATPLIPVRDFLRTRISEPVPIATLVRMSGLTESHLIRTFHREFGLPPHAYHLRIRLAEACRLLECGAAVSDVAYECGFADQSHLSRKFKEVYGLSPAVWAASLRGSDHPARPQSRQPPRFARRNPATVPLYAGKERRKTQRLW